MTFAAAADGSFETVALVFGGLLLVGGLISGLAQRSFLSLTALFVLAGFALGEGGFEVLEFDAGGSFVAAIAVVSLIVLLFRDGLEVEAEMLQTAWHLPFRKLVLAMPITCVLVAVCCKYVVGMDWTASLLVGALLTPTDPVLSSGVVTNPRVPRLVRHSLNLESGLNDGLALPAVLAFAAALGAEEDFVWWEFVLQDVTLGTAFGLVCGYAAAKAFPRRRNRLAFELPAHAQSLYALGVAFATYGITTVPPEGNGFIAVFVCAIVLGIMRPDIRENFEARADDVVEIVKLGIFLVFGALLTTDILFEDGLAGIALVAFTLLVARPVAIWIALARTGTDPVRTAFMAWFGPKGVATMTFSLFVLAEGLPESERIFGLAALCVFVSILVHGLSDSPLSSWLVRREERLALEQSETPRPTDAGAPA